MKDLTTDLDDKVVRALQNKVDSYETEISQLKDILEKKDEEFANLAKSKDDMSSELEETRSKLSDLESKTGDLDKLNSEVYDLKKTITLEENELNKLRAEVDEFKPRVAELTKNNDELKRNIADNESKVKELTDALAEKEKAFDDQKSRLEKAETELSALKPAEPSEYTSEERLICPKCGARGKDLKVEEDKSKILGYVGHSPMYGKTNVCKKCGTTF
ncbi:MAG: hypothetical protein CEE43_02610 [Promethearchaeota archaeon Loki_b32]|nr:MAG: hypothetical protein CEE43_02610 [Candidatus Lokiarchaeota archaeon Loki_b32]